MENQKEFERQSPDKEKMLSVQEANDLIKFEQRSPEVPAQFKPEGVGPMEIMMQAVQKGMGKEQLEVLERMFEFDIKVKAQQAKEAFYEAKAAFKRDVPAVIKDKKNKQYDSMYASEDALFNTVNPVLGKHGLEASFSYPKHENDKMFVVRCTLTHTLGHSEFVDADGPLDTSGSKNPLQQYKSTRTYLKKESYTAVTGIASADSVDDDGNQSLQQEFITEDQAKDITKRLKKIYGDDASMFLSYLGVDTIDTILAKDLKKTEQALKDVERRSKSQRQPGQEG